MHLRRGKLLLQKLKEKTNLCSLLSSPTKIFGKVKKDVSIQMMRKELLKNSTDQFY